MQMYDEMDQTYEAILARCLDRVSAPVDKREGSILYDALAPACAELARLYMSLSTLVDRAFPDTATGQDLDRKAAERAISRRAATAAVRQGTFTDAQGAPFPLEAGVRFSGGGLNYVSVQAAQGGVCPMRCETPGAAGNAWSGTLLPIGHVEGLAGAELGEVLVPGEDEESDEALRERYFGSFEEQAFGGNRADYRQRVREMAGVGGVQAERTPDGGGTVGVTIVASGMTAPTEELVAAVQQALDPETGHGEGLGIAPIGHTVHVAGVTARPVDVAFTLTLEQGVAWADVQDDVEAAIQDYFRDLTAQWEDTAAGLTVRVSQVERRVLDVPGVLDVAGTTLDGGTANVQLQKAQIPALGSVSHAGD